MQQPSTDKKENVTDDILALRALVKRQPTTLIYATEEVIKMLQLTASGKVRDYETPEETDPLGKFCATQRRNAVTLEQNFVLVLEQDVFDVISLGLTRVQHQFDTVCRITEPMLPESNSGLLVNMIKNRFSPEVAGVFVLNDKKPVI